jgi:N-acetylmuramoyl-L-alanine amidase
MTVRLRAPVLLTALALATAAGSALAGEPGPLVVVLDAGHGGKFPHDGAHGPHGLVEKNIALAVTLKVKALLEAQGATVVLTRDGDDDVALSQRAQIANESGGDLFLSIHCNSMESREDRKVTRGVETYFLSPDPTDPEAKMLAEMENGSPDAVPLPKTADPVSGLLADLALGQARNDSAQLAQIIHHNLIRGTWATSRGVRQAPFLVLSGTRMPSALVEIGFISHPAESRQLGKDKYQQRVAESLALGVREFADKVLARRLYAKGDPALTASADAAPPIGVATSGLVPLAPAPKVAAPGPTR